MRILLIGGAGYIGSAIAHHLIDRGHEPSVFDNLSTGVRQAVPAGVAFVHADCGNAEALAEAKRQGAAMIAFPEFLMAYSPGGQTAAELSANAESTDGPFIRSLRTAAKSTGVAVLATLYEPASVADRVYDSAVWIDAAGNIASVYRKLHLYDAFGFKESEKFHPGDDIAPFVECLLAGGPPVTWRGTRVAGIRREDVAGRFGFVAEPTPD